MLPPQSLAKHPVGAGEDAAKSKKQTYHEMSIKMAGKIPKNKKQTKTAESGSGKTAQILFAIFAIILILSMVLSAVTSF